MSPTSSGTGGELELIPLSALNHYLFCPRRAALIHLEGVFESNQHTLRGDIVHEHSDLAGYEVAKGTLLWRALPVWSERLGLNGKCDIVEVRDAGYRIPDAGYRMPDAGCRVPDGRGQAPDAGGRRASGESLFPVEFKLGKRRKWDNDDAQLCAQALCLEEMFGVPVPRGAVFHADSKRRREVEFTAELRALTERAIAEVHALLGKSPIPNQKSEPWSLPAAIFKPACHECSLYDICLPRATAGDGRPERLSRQLFQI